MPNGSWRTCCCEVHCEAFIVDAGHVLCGFVPIPEWAWGSHTVDLDDDTVFRSIIRSFIQPENLTLGLPDDRYEYASGDLRIVGRYLSVSYFGSGTNVDGEGSDAHPYVTAAWSRTGSATVNRHSGEIVAAAYSVTNGAGTLNYTYAKSMTTGAESTTGDLGAVQAARTDFPGWGPGGEPNATANISRGGATLSVFVPSSAYPVTGSQTPIGPFTFTAGVTMSDPFELEDCLAEAEQLLDQVDQTRAGDGSYTLTINGVAGTSVLMNTRLIVGWSGYPLAVRIQSLDYPPASGVDPAPTSIGDATHYHARRTFQWRFPVEEGSYYTSFINTALASVSLPQFFFNVDDNTRVGLRLAKSCITTGGLRVCCNSQNQEPPVASTAFPPSDNGSFSAYTMEDCVADWSPGNKICLDPADIIYPFGRMQLFRRCYSTSGGASCCDLSNP